MDAIPLLSLCVATAGVLIAVGGIIYHSGKSRGFQEGMQKAFDEFKAETKAKLNGLPVKVAILEQICHDFSNRITKHKLEADHEFEKLNDRINHEAR